MQSPNGSRESLLEEARLCITLPARLDIAGKIAESNLAYGIARLLHALQNFSTKSTIHFVCSADFTITRSPGRWGSGFSYGGLLEVFTEESDIVVPEVRPNTCGTLVGSLAKECSTQAIVQRIARITANQPPGSWDYSRRNHFVNLYRSSETGRQIFVMHGCPESLRSDGPDGPGLYIDSSKYWSSRIHTIKTPVGSVRLLLESNAREYWRNYVRCETYSKQHRREVAAAIFDEYEELSNETHEGMISPSTYLLGCHAPPDGKIRYPLMTTLGEPAYLVSAASSPREIVTGTGLRFLGLIPHGTGYSLPMVGSLFEVQCLEGGQLLFYIREGKGAVQVLRDFANVPYLYRSADIVSRWVSDDTFIVHDTLLPELFTKL